MFSSHGYSCPPSYNPADFLIGVLASAPGFEKASQRIAHRLCDLFAVCDASQERDLLVNLEMHMSDSAAEILDYKGNCEFKGPYWFQTTYWLINRSLLTVIRDPTIQVLRTVQKVAIALMAGLCFFGAIDLSQLGIQAVQGALFIFISENTFSPMYSVLAYFPTEFPLFLREKRSGIYSTAQYYLSNVIAMVCSCCCIDLITE